MKFKSRTEFEELLTQLVKDGLLDESWFSYTDDFGKARTRKVYTMNFTKAEQLGKGN